MAVRFIQRTFHAEFGTPPIILLENRTEQFLSTGHELARFATRIAQEDDLKSIAGIILDIQQLFTRTRSNFLDELRAIPPESVKGLHIHSEHRTPSESDPIPGCLLLDKGHSRRCHHQSRGSSPEAGS
jgi:hypothetical protein